MSQGGEGRESVRKVFPGVPGVGVLAGVLAGVVLKTTYSHRTPRVGTMEEINSEKMEPR